MKKLEFNLFQSANKDNLIMIFNNYKNEPSLQNAVLVINYLLSYYLSKYNINKMTLSYQKLTMQGAHESGHIMVDLKILKKAKRIDGLPQLIEVVLHEFCHELMQITNSEIKQTKIVTKEYAPEFVQGQMQKLFNDVFNGDLELSCYASMYYYAKNKNELIARQFSHNQMVNLLNEFMCDYNFNILSFEEKEELRNTSLLKDSQFKRHIYILDRAIAKYQKELLSAGLNNLSEEKINNLINSFSLVKTDEIRKNLVQELIKCNNLHLVKLILQTPVIQVLPQEKNELYNAYGKNSLQNVFYEYKMPEREV